MADDETNTQPAEQPFAEALLVRQVKGFRGRSIYSNHPQWPSEVAGTGSRAAHLQPAPIFFVRPVGVYENIGIAIPSARFGHSDFLMPAMLTADWVWLDRKGQVLMHACIFPLNTR